MGAIGPAGKGSHSARYSWLLAALAVLLGAPVFSAGGEHPIPALQAAWSAVLVSALFQLVRSRRVRWVGIALLVPALAIDWTAWTLGSPALGAIAALFAGAFLALVTAILFGSLLRSARVTTDTILGGICVYLLIGIVFASAYQALEVFAPGSLFEGGAPISGRADSIQAFHLPQIVYYSFVTLSTLGYGDIVPVSRAARGLAAAEALIGQIYIAVFVARLVGLHLVEATRR